MCHNYLNGSEPESLEVSVSYIADFHVPLQAFLDFMGAKKYSYKKLLKPVVDEGLIHIEGENPAREWDEVTGLVIDNITPEMLDLQKKTDKALQSEQWDVMIDSMQKCKKLGEELQSYVRFWIGKKEDKENEEVI
jgi:hypothetical protein